MLDVERTVGRYEIRCEIGRGGMAVVYLAQQTDLDREVALKELASFHASDETFAERFVRESRVVGSLNHPNVVTVYEYFEHEGTPYIAMEYVDRGSLRPWIGRLSVAQVAGAFEGVLAGLAHAAKRGIIHRDLKPENLMVTGEGTVKIADFGIAKALNQATVGQLLTATGTTVGTPTYMSPEQAMGRDLGPWTDLYSVGVMAYEMLVGRVPFHDAETPMAILMRHVNEPIPAPRSVRPDLEPDLAGWIERLLAKSPADRTQSAHQAWDELEEIVIALLGPRWRRDARLLEPDPPGIVTEEQPLTPAPFDAESDDGFETFQARRPPSESAASRATSPEQVTPPSAVDQPVVPVEMAREPTDTVPPGNRVPAGVTSFQWPSAKRRSSGRLLWIGLAVGIAIALMSLGALVTLSLGGSGDDASRQVTTTTTAKPKPRPKPKPEPKVVGPTARRTTVKDTGNAVLASIRFIGPPLRRRTLATRDGDLTDGSASVLVAQRGLKSVIGGNELAGLSIRPVASANHLTLVLSAKRGAFTTVKARPDRSGRSISIIATKKPKPKVVATTGGGSDGTTDTGGDSTTDGTGGGTGGDGGGGRDRGQKPCKPFLHKIGKC